MLIKFPCNHPNVSFLLSYLSSRLLDPVSLSVKKLKTLLDHRGVSYAGVVEKNELYDLVNGSGKRTLMLILTIFLTWRLNLTMDVTNTALPPRRLYRVH